MWPVTLSGRLPVNALVGHHPANKLIGRDPIPCRKKHFPPHHAVGRSIRYYHPFPGAIPVHRAGWSRITHPFATLTPAARPPGIPFDLHVLSTPPAFILSQNRTLHKKHHGDIQQMTLQIHFKRNQTDHPIRKDGHTKTPDTNQGPLGPPTRRTNPPHRHASELAS